MSHSDSTRYGASSAEAGNYQLHIHNPASVHSGSEYAGHAEIRRIFGISRAHLYRLAAEGLVRSACLKKQHAMRGRRLWHIPSIRALLESHLQKSGI
jgi:hypothetical protein